MSLGSMASRLRRSAAICCGCVLLSSFAMVLAQEPPPPPPDQGGPPPMDDSAQAPTQPMSPEQLDNLVAPIALYPDPLLGQILVASTYPLEVVELQQFLQQNRGLQGQELMDAVKQQNWDTSVQALAAFPDVVARLNQDVRWTTDLGNAFLGQQADVMNAVQRMRQRAEQNGKLASNQQQTVVSENQGGQPEIAIQPTDPQVIYVPSYNPAYIWGPPVYGYYPPLYYPGMGVGFSFFPGVHIGLFFGDCCGWGGWGWAPNWYGHTIFVNNGFFHRYGFRDYHGGYFRGDYRGQAVWHHDAEHRLGVPYPNRALAGQYRGGSFGAERGALFRGGPAPSARGGESFYNSRGNAVPSGGRSGFGSPGFDNRSSGGSHSVFGGAQEGGRARVESDHGYSSMGGRGGGGFSGGRGGGRGAAPRGSGGGGHASAPSRGGGRR